MKKNEEEQDFENGVFRVPCPVCGYLEWHALYEVDNFFGCPQCHEFAWLRYRWLDRKRRIVYGLQLVIEP